MRSIVIALAMAPGLAQAGEPPSPVKSPPVAHSYVSVFEGYRRFKEDAMRPWRDANDVMSRLGGHVGNLGNNAGTPLLPTPGTADKASPGADSRHRYQ